MIDLVLKRQVVDKDLWLLGLGYTVLMPLIVKDPANAYPAALTAKVRDQLGLSHFSDDVRLALDKLEKLGELSSTKTKHEDVRSVDVRLFKITTTGMLTLIQSGICRVVLEI